MKKFLPNNSKGFTLVELLVVISIIAILAVTGIVLYSGVSARGRDAKRIQEIQAIQTAMEKNYQPGATSPYPALATTDFANGIIPKDPRDGEAKCGTGIQSCVYCFYPAGTATGGNTTTNGTSCSTGTPVVAGATTSSAGKGYLICANLETAAGLSGATYYCRANAQ